MPRHDPFVPGFSLYSHRTIKSPYLWFANYIFSLFKKNMDNTKVTITDTPAPKPAEKTVTVETTETPDAPVEAPAQESDTNAKEEDEQA